MSTESAAEGPGACNELRVGRDRVAEELITDKRGVGLEANGLEERLHLAGWGPERCDLARGALLVAREVDGHLVLLESFRLGAVHNHHPAPVAPAEEGVAPRLGLRGVEKPRSVL